MKLQNLVRFLVCVRDFVYFVKYLVLRRNFAKLSQILILRNDSAEILLNIFSIFKIFRFVGCYFSKCPANFECPAYQSVHEMN